MLLEVTNPPFQTNFFTKAIEQLDSEINYYYVFYMLLLL